MTLTTAFGTEAWISAQDPPAQDSKDAPATEKPDRPVAPTAEALSREFRELIQKVSPMVVSVRTVGAADPLDVLGPFARDPNAVPSKDPGGSGVILDAAAGVVLTNEHVVRSGAQIVVTLSDGRERVVREVRKDPRSDLALVFIEPRGLKSATWGDSEALRPGDWVLAVGQPFGLSNTVTAGIVSGLGRTIGRDSDYEDWLQTDAAINPGNSGGPLVNLKGEVVGINAAIKTQSGVGEGVGFAIPAHRAKRVAEDLLRFGRVRRSYLGMSVQKLDPDWREDIDQPGAVVITSMSADGPARLARLRVGDVIIAAGGTPVQGVGMMQSVIESAPTDRPLVLKILRETPIPKPKPESGKAKPANATPARIPLKELTIEVLPAALPEPARTSANAGAPPAIPRPPMILPETTRQPTRFPALGLRLEEIDAKMRERMRLEPEIEGVIVAGITPDGPADRGGFTIGMIITDIGSHRVTSLPDIRAALAQSDEQPNLVIHVRIGNKSEFRVIMK